MTLSNKVSQRRASGQRDMTPNVTGTRRIFARADHDSCTSVGLASAAAKYNDRANRMPLNGIVVRVVVDKTGEL